jgi:hypothetical protein
MSFLEIILSIYGSIQVLQVMYIVYMMANPAAGRQDTNSHPYVRDGIAGDVELYGGCQVVESEAYAQVGA